MNFGNDLQREPTNEGPSSRPIPKIEQSKTEKADPIAALERRLRLLRQGLRPESV